MTCTILTFRDMSADSCYFESPLNAPVSANHVEAFHKTADIMGRRKRNKGRIETPNGPNIIKGSLEVLTSDYTESCR